MRRILLSAAMVLVMALTAWATPITYTYYVDPVGGDDTTGLSADHAFLKCTTVLSTTFALAGGPPHDTSHAPQADDTINILIVPPASRQPNGVGSDWLKMIIDDGNLTNGVNVTIGPSDGTTTILAGDDVAGQWYIAFFSTGITSGTFTCNKVDMRTANDQQVFGSGGAPQMKLVCNNCTFTGYGAAATTRPIKLATGSGLDVVLSYCTFAGWAEIISGTNLGNVTIDHCTATANIGYAGQDGPVLNLYSVTGALTITNNTFTLTAVPASSGLIIYDPLKTTSVTFSNNVVSDVIAAPTISGATAAAPCVLTVSSAANIATGDTVQVAGVTGNMGGVLNGNYYVVTVSGSTLSLAGSDTSGKTYTAGGTATRVSQRSVAIVKFGNVADDGGAHASCSMTFNSNTVTAANTSGAVVGFGDSTSNVTRAARYATLYGGTVSKWGTLTIDSNKITNTYATGSGALGVEIGFTTGTISNNSLSQTSASASHTFEIASNGLEVKNNYVCGAIAILIFGDNLNVHDNTFDGFGGTAGLLGKPSGTSWEVSLGCTVTRNVFLSVGPDYAFSDYAYNDSDYAVGGYGGTRAFNNVLLNNIYIAPFAACAVSLSKTAGADTRLQATTTAALRAKWASYGTAACRGNDGRSKIAVNLMDVLDKTRWPVPRGGPPLQP